MQQHINLFHQCRVGGRVDVKLAEACCLSVVEVLLPGMLLSFVLGGNLVLVPRQGPTCCSGPQSSELTPTCKQLALDVLSCEYSHVIPRFFRSLPFGFVLSLCRFREPPDSKHVGVYLIRITWFLATCFRVNKWGFS